MSPEGTGVLTFTGSTVGPREEGTVVERQKKSGEWTEIKGSIMNRHTNKFLYRGQTILRSIRP